jgi:SAM-dependent methyltransferase
VCVACRGQRLEQISEQLSYRYEQADGTSTWRYRWLRCAGCELAMLDPEPSLAIIQSFIPQKTASSWRERLGNSFSLVSWCLATQLPKDAVILDLCSSDARWLSLLAARGYRRLHGHIVAALPERVATLRERGIVVTDGSFLGHEFPSASYDCIRIDDALARLPEPAATVRQCLRMLKPSGVLLLHAPAPRATWPCLSRARLAQPDQAPCHVYHHTTEALRSLLAAAGFRDLHTLQCGSPEGLPAIFNGMRQQAGKSALPGWLGLLLRPVFLLASLWGDQRDWLTLVAREPTAVQLRPSTNGHSRGLRHALFTRF